MIGAIISHYKITEKLGGGGMGVVYKADDTRLNRSVALKFLPVELTTDPSAKERFLKEARAASSLDHPNICDVHDIGETDDGQTYIVMSFYEGETLKKKISRGRLKIEQALDIASQIADGLAKAHELGIVHRDIKPANILVTKEGIAKIVDFGLAKLAGESRLTKTGATVGTLAYMSPEQVQSQDVDARTDIWSLGAILYEMVTGVAPFKGDHEGALLYEIISAEPTSIRESIPDAEPELEQLIGKCLEKDSDERYQGAKDVSVDCRRLKREMKTIRQMSAMYSRPGRGDSPSMSKRYAFAKSSKSRSRQTWIAVSVVLMCVTAYLMIRDLTRDIPAPLFAVVAELSPPENGKFQFVGAHAGPIVLSPDGRRVAYVIHTKNDGRMLWIRRLDEVGGKALIGTDGASYPFWSPDGRSIAFFSASMLRKIDIDNGVVLNICPASYGLGGSWNRQGTILFSSSRSEPIYQVSEYGGVARAVTALDMGKKEIYHQFPFFLPDGDHFLFLARTTFTNNVAGADEICVSSLSDHSRKSIVSATSNAAYSSGYILYVNSNNNNLTAAKFDLETHSIMGESVPLEPVMINSVDGGGVFTASNGSMLAYQRPPTSLKTRLVMYDRTGKELSTIGPKAAYWDVRFSPDGKRIAYSVVDSLENNIDIWLYDPATPQRKLIASGKSTERMPVWSRDGKEIFFFSDRVSDSGTVGGDHRCEIYRKSLASGAREIHMPTIASCYVKQPFDCSPDGKFLAFVTASNIANPKNQCDIWFISLDGNNTLVPFLQEEENEWDPRFSSDGNWVAYCSEQTKQSEIYVARYGGPSGREPISYQGGGERPGGRSPRWARGGNEILYLTLDNKLIAAQLKPEGPDIRVLDRKFLFQTNAISYGGNFDVSPDGSKIIINTVDDWGGPVNVVSNWTELIKKR